MLSRGWLISEGRKNGEGFDTDEFEKVRDITGEDSF
jgi:hypothetical protein